MKKFALFILSCGIAVSLANAETLYLGRDLTRIQYPNGWRDDFIRSGQNYDTGVGFAPRNQSLIETGDPVWPIGIQASDWQLRASTDSLQFRAETPDGDGIEYAISDIGLHWFDDATGTDTFVSLGWDITGGESIITGNVLNRDLATGLEYVAIAGVNGLKVNTIWSAPAIAAIPAPTQVIAATAAAEDVYVSMILDIYDWTSLGVFADDSYVGNGAIWTGTAIEFRSMVGTELSFEQTKAYRNPGFVSSLGDSFSFWESYSEVLYTVDRLNSRIYIDAPYQLFIDAQAVVVDPPITWTSEQGTSDDGTFLQSGSPTTNNGTSAVLQTAEYAGQVTVAPFRWTGVPSVAVIGDVSARCVFVYAAQGDTSNSPIAMRRTADGRDWVETEATWNIYKTSNNWTTAGAGDGTTDYDATTPATGGNAANLTIYNNAIFNSWVSGWITGSHANNGIILDATDNSVQYKQYHSDDAVSASNRPLLVITYWAGNGLHHFPPEPDMQVVGGSLGCSVILGPTTAYYDVAGIADSVSAQVLAYDGTESLVGDGPDADFNWTGQFESPTIDGATHYFIVSNIAIDDIVSVVLTNVGDLVEEKLFAISPGGGGSSYDSRWDQASFAAIQDVTTNSTWGLLAQKTRFDTVDSSLSALSSLYKDQAIAGNTMLVSDSTGDYQIRVCLPPSIDLELEQTIEILGLSSVADATFALWANLRDNENQSLAYWHYVTGDLGGWTVSRATDTGIDNNNLYSFRLRRQITPADISSVTGPAQLIVSASTPVGVRSMSVPVRVVDTQAVSQQTDFDDVIASNEALEGTVKKRTLGNAYQVYAAPGYAIAGSTYGATFDVGYMNVPVGEPVCVLNTEVDADTGAETVTNIIFFDYVEVSPGVYLPQHLRKEYGALSYYSNGIIKSCTETQALEHTGWSIEAFVGRTPTDTYGE